MVWEARHITVSIERPPNEVAAYAGRPENLPAWAAGLGSGIREEGGRWYADMPMGRVAVRFTGPEAAGVLDHEVTLPDGTVVYNPLRVLPNDRGSEVVMTVFRREGVSDAEFDADAAAIAADLETLGRILEA